MRKKLKYALMPMIFFSSFSLARLGSPGFNLGLSNCSDILSFFETFAFIPLAGLLTVSIQQLINEAKSSHNKTSKPCTPWDD